LSGYVIKASFLNWVHHVAFTELFIGPLAAKGFNGLNLTALLNDKVPSDTYCKN
jgi:hypothetical protein